MKRLMKYVLRGIMMFAVSLLLNVFAGALGIMLPVNFVTGAICVLFGLPGIVLSIAVCNFVI